MTGVFMEITNPGTEPITLVGGSSEISSTVEIHEVVMKDDALVMQPKVGGITIQPGETHVLEMGGDHVMLMDLKKAIMAGDLITVSLDLEGAEDVTLEGLVAKTSDGGDEDYNHGEEGHSH
jgi:copper(I)-binding protein